MAVVFLLKLRNRRKQPDLASSLTIRDRPIRAISYFFSTPGSRVDHSRRLHANIAAPACAPVAQRIEHLPCWSLNEESFDEELIEWTAPYAGTPLEPQVLNST
jgi:hypothetical protein